MLTFKHGCVTRNDTELTSRTDYHSTIRVGKTVSQSGTQTLFELDGRRQQFGEPQLEGKYDAACGQRWYECIIWYLLAKLESPTWMAQISLPVYANGGPSLLLVLVSQPWPFTWLGMMKRARGDWGPLESLASSLQPSLQARPCYFCRLSIDQHACSTAAGWSMLTLRYTQSASAVDVS